MSIKSVKFRGRHLSAKSITVLITGALSLIALVVMSVIAGVNNGMASFLMGIVGIAAFIVSVIGFVISITCTRERDIYYAVPLAGMSVNGVTMLMYIIVYIVGIV